MAKTKKEKKEKKAKRKMSDFQYFALQTLIIVIILYVLFARMVGIKSMPNTDMYPRIDSGDFLLFYRLDRSPKAQDVVVLEKNDTHYVSRVIAVGGDTVDITEDGEVKVNGYTMVETNIFYETYPLEGFTSYPLTLEPDECFVLADQRQGAEDSRFFGPVKYRDIEGTVISILRRNNL
jgi:signal peptidase I